MKKDWLENNMYEKLSDYGSELDLDQAWADLSARRKRKRRPAWWIFPVLLLGILVAFLLVDQPEISNPTNQEQAINTLTFLDSGEHKNAAQTDPDIKTEESTIQNYRMEETAAGNSSRSALSTSKDLESDQRSSERSPDRQVNTAGFVQDENPSNSKRDQNKEAKDVIADADNSIYEVMEPSTSVVESTEQADLSMPASSRTLMKELPVLDLFMPVLNSENPELPVLFREADMENIRPPSANWSVGITAGYGLSTRELTTGGDSLALQRRDSEEAVDYWTVGISLRREIGTNWLLQVGLGIENAYARLERSGQNSYTEIQPDQVLSIFEYANGDIELIRGEGEVTITETSRYDLWQEYRSLAIPISIGYTFSSSDLVAFRPVVGLTWIARHQVTGRTLISMADNDVLMDIEPLYQTSNFFRAHAGVELEFRLSDQFTTLISATGGLDLTSRAARNQAFKDQFQGLGVQVGAFYHW